MKKFFKWFKSSTKIKRWIFLILIGIILVCYGMARILVDDELELYDLALTIISFIFGFTFVVIGIIFIQKRTLELLVQESDTRNIEKEKNVDTLIFNKKVYNQGPKVVVIGGGSGLNTVIKGLKQYTNNVTAIVTVSDYGAPKDSGANPLENIKDSIIALSNNETEMARLMNTKFDYIQGQPYFSDLYFTAMEEAYGNFAKSIEASKEVLAITGRVLPVTLDEVNICAELEDGTVIDSKEKIPKVVNEKVSKIDRVYLSPTNCRVAPGVLEAIREADAIVIGPGSIYTNVIPNLLVAGVTREIKQSNAFKIYVGNIMTELGQTDNFTLSDHVKTIIDHAGEGVIDYCIYDTGEIMPEYIRKYNKEGSELVEQDVNKVKELGIKLIQRKLSVVENGTIKHNADAIATSIIQLICDELKFNDMQNNTQFIMLDSKVKDTKKRLRKDLDDNEIRYNYNKNRRSKHRVSKFFAKYNTRIESIRESENETKRKKNKINNQKKIEKKEETIETKAKKQEKIPDDIMKQFNTQKEHVQPDLNKTATEKKSTERRNLQPKTTSKVINKNVENSKTDNKLIHKTGGKHGKHRDIVNDKDFRNILDKMMK